MTINEFQDAVEEVLRFSDDLNQKELTVTPPEFNLIDMLHKYHPSLSKDNFTSRKQLAWIYANLGMRPIIDMIPTAQKMKRCLDNLDIMKGLYENAKAQVKELNEDPIVTDNKADELLDE